jgi:predicted DNA-binding transcriptional regulator AlpA
MSKDPLFGIAELAQATGHPRGTLSQWYRRGKLPEPAATLAMGPVWTGPEVTAWIEDHRRCPAPPPAATSDAVRDQDGAPDERGDDEPARPTGSEQYASAVDAARGGISESLARLGYAAGIVAQVVDELLIHITDSTSPASTSPTRWCVARADELTHELDGARRADTARSPIADPSDDLCPHARPWLACEICVAAGEALRRKGLRSVWNSLGGDV